MTEYFYFVDKQGQKQYYHFLGLDGNKIVGEHTQLGDVHEFDYDQVIFLMYPGQIFEEIN